MKRLILCIAIFCACSVNATPKQIPEALIKSNFSSSAVTDAQFAPLKPQRFPNRQKNLVQVTSSSSSNAMEASPYGDRYSLAPLVQDAAFAYYMTATQQATTHVFDDSWETVGANQYGTSNGRILVFETTKDLENGDTQVSVQVTAVNAQNEPEPWVDANFSHEELTEWRLDIGTTLGGSNPITPDLSYEIKGSGVSVFDSAGERIGNYSIDDTSNSGSLSGQALIGLSGSNIAGYDLATMIVYWNISAGADPADLALTIIDAEDGTYKAGDTLRVDNKVENIGGSTSEPYRLTFYASSNTSISTSDYNLGYTDRPALGEGENHYYYNEITIPASLPKGAYYVGAILTINDAKASNNTKYDSTPITIATVPDAPTLNSVEPGDRKAVLRFTANGNGGSAITGYTAKCGSFSQAGSSSPITVGGLSNGQTYSCSVVARNAIGNSASSNVLSVTPNGNSSSYKITGGQSGAWVDPNDDGEGFFLQILSDNQAVVFWFTYDTNRKQMWMIGVGRISGSEIVFDELLAPRGGKFGPDFDPDDVEYPVWGSLRFNFTDCHTANVQYSGTPEFGSGSFKVRRLTSLWGVDCHGVNRSTPTHVSGVLNTGFSGAWGDIQHDGEGFVVEILDQESAVIIWFTYDSEGNPAWMLDVASISDSTLLADNILISSNGIFGPDNEPNDHNLESWGVAAFTFGACSDSKHSGAMRYIPDAGFGPESTQLLYRITSISGIECKFLRDTHSIDGTMSVAQNIFLDGDVNNPDEPESSNDLDGGEPQLLTSPANVVGYVTAEATGESGDRFETEIDEYDVYVIPIKESESVSLEISDWETSDKEKTDLDLYLFNVNDPETLVDSSLSVEKVEYVTANESGNYFVIVSAHTGGSNYLLKSGQPTPLSYAKLSLATEFRSDEVIAKLTAQARLTSENGRKERKIRIEQFEKGSALTRLEVNPSDEILYEVSRDRFDTLLPHPLTQSGFGSVTADQWRVIRTVKKIAANPDYQWAGPNYIHDYSSAPNDPGFPYQWHYTKIRLPEAWNLTTGSRNVVVAVLDSGIYDHPDLISNVDYSIGYDFVSSIFNSEDFDGRDPDARDPGTILAPLTGYISHGTHVAGTVGAASNNGFGVAGVNWDVTIMPVRVGGPSGPVCWDINEGLKWAGRLPNITGTIPARKADVINLSFGGSAPCPGADEVINELTAKGTIVIAAAGNKGNTIPHYPAALPNVVSVSATTITDQLAHYSSFGSTIDLAAPGGDVDTDINGDSFPDGVLSNLMGTKPGTFETIVDYMFLPGTSMASPHVAGVAALMKSIYPELDSGKFKTAISSGEITVDLAQNGEKNKDSKFGYGRLDAHKAVQWAYLGSQGVSTGAFLTSSVYSLDFGSNKQSINFQIEKEGGGQLSIVDRGVTETWMSLSQVTVDNQGMGTYRITINRGGLLEGQYLGWAGIKASDDSILWISVAMRVGEVIQGRAGMMYALLLDNWTTQNIKQWSGNSGGGKYQINLPDNPPGRYYLLVGSDIDNDYSICDAGEFCQLYPMTNTATELIINSQDIQLGHFRLGMPIDPLATSSFIGNSSSEKAGQKGQSNDFISRIGDSGFKISRR